MLLSKINEISKPGSIECPICRFACRDRDDQISVLNEGACTECFVNFRYLLGERWDLGERPSILEARKKMGYKA